ncbi:MAG: ribosome maturation factor RimM [Aquabacterium sp.]|uniref:ribosome maturation factor RimM n=1 Tax=Aquabacterium sp. TaxID=1872578 RepID=UPI00271DCD2C|nr:ribosome maturation factor RimM [Aquabacterium sp.]MDO9006162.1 ribosome maturation factor RimM [Aquabacterium sp.]
MNDRVAAPSLGLDDEVAWPEDAVEVARIGEAWGIQGGFKVQPFSGDPQALFCTKRWFLRPAEVQPGVAVRPVAKSAAPAVARLSAPRTLKIKNAREQGDTIVATADGITDRNGAEVLRGARVFVSRSAFPTPDSDEFYWIDLLGLTVVNRQDEVLGTVADLIDTGAHSVLRCVDEANTERLIPFVSAYIDSVSLADKRIVADWGLDY